MKADRMTRHRFSIPFFRLSALILVPILLLALCTACGTSDNPSGNTTPASAGSEGVPSQPSGNQDPDPDPDPDPAPTPVTYPLNSTTPGIRVLGERYLASAYQINCDWSCSGIELNLRTEGGDITFTARVSAPFDASCYFRAYVDDAPWESENGVYYTVGSAPTAIALKNVPAGEHCVRLVKVTGYTLARAELLRVSFAGTILEDAPEQKPLYIEFIGDSICCGWGTIGNLQGAYTDQDGTLAYPYLTAKALQADYAVTALSGQGLLRGTPGTLQGYRYASALRSTAEPYVASRKADVTVINIGTNDASLNQPLQFRQALRELLGMILEQNPGGRICMIYNTMNSNYPDEIRSLCEEAGGAAAGIYTLCFDRATGEGNPTNHPSVAEQQREAEKLTAFLQEILAVPVTAVPFAPPEPVETVLEIRPDGTGIFLDWNTGTRKEDETPA